MTVLQGELADLRPLATDDAERVNAWHNDAALYETLMGDLHSPTLEQTRTWLSERRAARDELNLAICMRDTTEHIGNAYLRDIDPATGIAEYHGLFLGTRGPRGRGVGRDVTDTLMRHALGPLGLRRIFGDLFADNLPSLRMMQAVGFEIEAHLPAHVVKDGRPRDVVRMVITALQ